MQRTKHRQTGPAANRIFASTHSLPLGALVTGMLPAPIGALAADETTLPQITVQDDRLDDTPEGYQGGTTRVGKIDQLAKDVPQALTVVSQQLMQETNANTLKEALRHVSGLTFNAAEGGRIGDNMMLRGFYSFGDLYLDGIRDVAQYNRETFNLEQVDVLRGSAAMLFGRGQAGGVINQASKQPLLKNRNEVTLTGGTDSYRRGTADLNHVLSDHTAVRLNVMHTDAGSTRNHVTSEREGAAPSIAFGLGTAHELTLSHYYLKTHNTPDYGVPFFQQRPLEVSKDTFFGTTDDYEDNRTNISTASYKYAYSVDTTLRTVLRHANYTRDLWAVAPRLAAGATEASIANGTAILNRGRQARGGEEKTWTSQTDLSTRFDTGWLKHELLLGLELLDEEAGRWSYNTIASAVAPPTTVGNPNASPLLPPGYGNRIKNGATTYEGRTWAPYVQDMVEFMPGWKVFAGARWDELDADYSTGAKVKYGEWSYRAGLSHQPTDFQHYYAAWSDSFNPTADLYQFTPSSVVWPAERSRTYELGAKWELFEGDLSLRASVYHTEKTWERNTDIETAGGNPLLTKKRHTDGIELEAAGRITARWEVFASTALMDPRIDTARPGGNPNVEGMRPRNAPTYTYNLWTTYQLDHGWKVGAGVEAKAKRLAYGIRAGTEPIAPNVAPSYQRWDAMLAYENRRYEVKLNLKNVFDKRYYESLYENGGFAVPGTGRALQLVTELKF